MKRREKSSSSTNAGNAQGQTLPTVVRSSCRSRSTSPHKRTSFSKAVPFSKQRRGHRQFCDWIQVLLLLCILGALFKSVRWLQVSTFEEDDTLRVASEYSSLTVHVSSSGTGLMNKYFYRFKNVRIWRNRIKFFYDPDGTFQPPTEEHWVDIISCNATSPRPPTMLVIKVDAPTRWEYLPIDYIPVTRGADACHAGATSVVKRPAYLLQVRYSYNIWHTWGEAGLMSLFQTLREINLLPIATVDNSGSLIELGDGGDESQGDPSRHHAAGNGDGGCPWTYDPTVQRAVRKEPCKKLRISRGASCSRQSQAWCRPGAVVSPLRDDPSAAPLIVTYTPQSTINVWSHLYDTISSSQKNLSDLEGACFEDIIVGKSSTLNFYQALNTTTPAATILEKVPRIDNSKARVEAMAVFKAFIISSQQELVERKGLVFEGYHNPGLETLRRGVTDPDAEAIDAMNPRDCMGNIREEIEELRKNFKAHEELVAPSIVEYEQRYGPVVVPSSLSSRRALELRDEESGGYFALRDNSFGGAAFEVKKDGEEIHKPTKDSATTPKDADLPVVTYMSRDFFSRGVINEGSILKYVLENYRVLLKVTTFQEPLGDVMDILSTSDVIFGMHGAGWTNLLFMKQGATAMQMFPYGWRLPDNSTVRGFNYREIVYASEGKCVFCSGMFLRPTMLALTETETPLRVRYLEWVNPDPQNAYMRRIDFKKGPASHFLLHPDDDEALPKDSWPGNQWIYQNTYVNLDTADFRDAVDEMMRQAGIPPVT